MTAAPPNVTWIADLPAWERVLPDLAAADSFALDTETNGLHAYQARSASCRYWPRKVYLLDILRLGLPDLLADLLKDRSSGRSCMAASHDVASLKEDSPAPFAGSSTPMSRRRSSDSPRSPSPIYSWSYTKSPTKAWQKKDWTIRPPAKRPSVPRARCSLSPDLARDLTAKGLPAEILDEIEIECARVETQATETAFDPIGYLWMKGTECARGDGDPARGLSSATDGPSNSTAPPSKCFLTESSWRWRSQRPIPRPSSTTAPSSRVGRPVGATRTRGRGRNSSRPSSGATTRESGEDLDEADRRDKAREEEERREARTARPRALRGPQAFRREEAERRKVTPIVVLPNWGSRIAGIPAQLENSPGAASASRVSRYGETITRDLAQIRHAGEFLSREVVTGIVNNP